MNPGIPAGDAELGRWLTGFATSHAKREGSRVEARVEVPGGRAGRSYGLRLRLGDRTVPPPDDLPIELPYAEVAAGRNEFAWCRSLAERVRQAARQLTTEPSRPPHGEGS